MPSSLSIRRFCSRRPKAEQHEDFFRVLALLGFAVGNFCRRDRDIQLRENRGRERQFDIIRAVPLRASPQPGRSRDFVSHGRDCRHPRRDSRAHQTISAARLDFDAHLCFSCLVWHRHGGFLSLLFSRLAARRGLPASTRRGRSREPTKTQASRSTAFCAPATAPSPRLILRAQYSPRPTASTRRGRSDPVRRTTTLPGSRLPTDPRRHTHHVCLWRPGGPNLPLWHQPRGGDHGTLL